MRAGERSGPKLAEVAERIRAHLARFEADPVVNPTQAPFYRKPRVEVNSKRVIIGYYSTMSAGCYDGKIKKHSLKKAEALAYLAWLDAGNVGRHYEQQRAAARSV